MVLECGREVLTLCPNHPVLLWEFANECLPVSPGPTAGGNTDKECERIGDDRAAAGVWVME